MVCQYCNKRLGLIQRLKGQSFCSAEHQELHFGLSFERLRASVSEATPPKVKPLWPPNKAKLPEAEPEQTQANAEQPQAELEQSPVITVQPQAVSDQQQTELEEPQANPIPVAEPQLAKAAQDISPTLEIASLVDAIGVATGVDLPEAPFLPELPSRQDHPLSPLMSLRCGASFCCSCPVAVPRLYRSLRSGPRAHLSWMFHRPSLQWKPRRWRARQPGCPSLKAIRRW